MTSASLAVSIIGPSLAQARGLICKHAIKQVDRLSSNRGVVVWEIFAPWMREVVGPRKEIVVAMDWTEFDPDDQTTLALNLVARHGDCAGATSGNAAQYGFEVAQPICDGSA
jgi:hypothetical protein